MVELFRTKRLEELLPKVKAFMEEEIYPIELELLKQPFSETHKKLRSLKPKVEALGCWNLYLSKEHGGAGMCLTEVAQLSEVIGSSFLGHYAFNIQAPDAGNIELLLDHGTPEMKEKYLEPLLRGESRSCFSMTEPHTAGSNPTLLATTAVREGDEYVINGHKWFTTAADGADFAIAMVVTNPEMENPYMRASMIIVPTDTPGFNFVRNVPIMGHAGSGWMSHAEIKYENARVPVSNRIGAEGAGFVLAQERLGPGRIHHCMRWIGIAERSFEMMCKRAMEREIGRGKVLGDKQMIQTWVAESRAEIDAARLMVLHTAYKIDHLGKRAAAQDISAIKFFASNVLHKVVNRAIQTHGALGITDDTILSFFYREERGASIYDGTDETHKASLARKILKNYRKN